MPTLCTVSLVVFLTLPGLAQSDTAALSGVLKDQTGAVLARYGTVSLESDSRRRWETAPDELGKFEFAQLPPAAYALHIRAPGFKNVDLRFDLGKGDKRYLPLTVPASVMCVGPPTAESRYLRFLADDVANADLGVLEVKIVSEEKPVEGARLKLGCYSYYCPDGFQEQTDISGSAQFHGLRSGELVLTVERTGFWLQSLMLIAFGGTLASYEIPLVRCPNGVCVVPANPKIEVCE